MNCTGHVITTFPANSKKSMEPQKFSTTNDLHYTIIPRSLVLQVLARGLTLAEIMYEISRNLFDFQLISDFKLDFKLQKSINCMGKCYFG